MSGLTRPAMLPKPATPVPARSALAAPASAIAARQVTRERADNCVAGKREVGAEISGIRHVLEGEHLPAVYTEAAAPEVRPGETFSADEVPELDRGVLDDAQMAVASDQTV